MENKRWPQQLRRPHPSSRLWSRYYNIAVKNNTSTNNKINVIKIGRNLMHLEMFVARESNLRDEQMDELSRTISRFDINLTTFKIQLEAQMEKLDTYLGN